MLTAEILSKEHQKILCSKFRNVSDCLGHQSNPMPITCFSKGSKSVFLIFPGSAIHFHLRNTVVGLFCDVLRYNFYLDIASALSYPHIKIYHVGISIWCRTGKICREKCRFFLSLTKIHCFSKCMDTNKSMFVCFFSSCIEK